MARGSDYEGGSRGERYRRKFRAEHTDRAGSVSRGRRPTPPGVGGEFAVGEPRRRWAGQGKGPKPFKLRVRRRPTPPGTGEFATGEPRRRWAGQSGSTKLFKLAKRRT